MADVFVSEPERRQIARSLQFNARTAFAIDWNKIAQTARELGAHFEARTDHDGAVVVTMFWAYDGSDAVDPNPLAEDYPGQRISGPADVATVCDYCGCKGIIGDHCPTCGRRRPDDEARS